MREEDIRPAKLKSISDKLFAADAKRLLKHQVQFIAVNCPACGTSNSKLWFKKTGYTFRVCEKCETCYISPRPKAKLLGLYYSTASYYKFWMKFIFPVSRQARINNIYKPRVDILKKYIKDHHVRTNMLVDIGAGSGDFGQEVNSEKLFDQIILVEPGEIAVKPTSSIKVINSVFEDANLPKSINVITSFETLEHLFSPIDFLKLVYSRLSHKGMLMLSTVNHHGFDILVLSKKSEYLIGPDHLNVFTIDSIKILLKRAGFKKVEVTTPGQLDVDLILSAFKNKLIDLKKHPFLHHMLIEKGDIYSKSFQEFLQFHKLSSHMLVIAEK